MLVNVAVVNICVNALSLMLLYNVTSFQAASSDYHDVDAIVGSLIQTCFAMLDTSRVSLFMVDELSEQLWCRYGNVGCALCNGKL